MQVVVRLFAMYREAVGNNLLHWEVADGATAEDLWHALRDRYPQLPQVKPAVAINAEYARLDTVLQPGDEVAFLPPVSGGGPPTGVNLSPKVGSEPCQRRLDLPPFPLRGGKLAPPPRRGRSGGGQRPPIAYSTPLS